MTQALAVMGIWAVCLGAGCTTGFDVRSPGGGDSAEPSEGGSDTQTSSSYDLSSGSGTETAEDGGSGDGPPTVSEVATDRATDPGTEAVTDAITEEGTTEGTTEEGTEAVTETGSEAVTEEGTEAVSAEDSARGEPECGDGDCAGGEDCGSCAADCGPCEGTGSGLKGEYYDEADFTAFEWSRVDAVVDFDWGNGSPFGEDDDTPFSVRWTGEVEPRYAEVYTFTTYNSDGVRLWIDGELLIENWTSSGPTERGGDVELEAGARYELRLKFYEDVYGAEMTLKWSSESQEEEVIPTSRLYPAP